MGAEEEVFLSAINSVQALAFTCRSGGKHLRECGLRGRNRRDLGRTWDLDITNLSKLHKYISKTGMFVDYHDLLQPQYEHVQTEV
ncbi:hypothetical protein EOD39_18367 [Acipenser ruthenus]|uniref:Uncharacterized protein n=1 Tax=Acipenser ruthenus TaxID=7906 RepID=A0A444U4B5_ACIRT|nr:hypothetical protein EOD39_18367 [Acipenser ruthenus]